MSFTCNVCSAVFIMCGSPKDILEAKNGTKEADNSDILFLLIDLYKSVINTCTALLPEQHRFITAINNEVAKLSMIPGSNILSPERTEQSQFRLSFNHLGFRSI